MAAGRRIAELASEPWQIGHGRTLCEEKVWASLEFPANLCCTFHNVRLSITEVPRLRLTNLELERHQSFQPPMVEEQIDEELALPDLNLVLQTCR